MSERGVTHKVKISAQWWTEIATGRKTSELRRDDRDYQIGDAIKFYQPNSAGQAKYYMGTRVITHVLKNCEEWGLQPGFVILSLNNPDYDWHVEVAQQRREWLVTAERRVAALKGAMTKQRKKYDQLMDD